jgi:hypothetical protein
MGGMSAQPTRAEHMVHEGAVEVGVQAPADREGTKRDRSTRSAEDHKNEEHHLFFFSFLFPYLSLCLT